MKNNNNYIRNKKNHARQCVDNGKASLKASYERKVTNEQKYGTNDQLINIGEADRIGLNAPQIIDDKQLQLSYFYGYFERGSRVLAGKFSQGVYSEEEQRNFGIHDVIYNVPVKFLTNLKEYPAYLSGRLFELGAKAYEFAFENNMSLEDYIGLMNFINPEVTTKEFAEGFLARENEINNKKGSR